VTRTGSTDPRNDRVRCPLANSYALPAADSYAAPPPARRTRYCSAVLLKVGAGAGTNQDFGLPANAADYYRRGSHWSQKTSLASGAVL
jgi:hypothetical protein